MTLHIAVHGDCIYTRTAQGSNVFAHLGFYKHVLCYHADVPTLLQRASRIVARRRTPYVKVVLALWT